MSCEELTKKNKEQLIDKDFNYCVASQPTGRNSNFKEYINKKTHQNLLCGTSASYRAQGFLLVLSVFILINSRFFSDFYSFSILFI